MTSNKAVDISYFPGCSLATSARESNLSLYEVCKKNKYGNAGEFATILAM